MAKDFSRKFYNSRAWEKCREGYKQSKFGICERCEDPGVEVHHKIYITPENINNPNITLNWDNLELLCMSCHNKEHKSSGEGVTREGMYFNEYGELVEGKPTPPFKMAE